MRKGDVVTEVAGEQVPDGIALIVAIRAHQPATPSRSPCSAGDRSCGLRITLGSQVG